MRKSVFLGELYRVSGGRHASDSFVVVAYPNVVVGILVNRAHGRKVVLGVKAAVEVDKLHAVKAHKAVVSSYVNVALFVLHDVGYRHARKSVGGGVVPSHKVVQK